MSGITERPQSSAIAETSGTPVNARPQPATPTSAAPAAERDSVRTSPAASGGVPAATVSLDAAPSTPNRQTDQAPTFRRKGTLTASWGYNRAVYGPSTIHFQGANHDFTLHNVRASDRPTFQNAGDFASRVTKTDLTIPQYNFRIGYYLTDQTSVSLGIDHMKYVVDKNQPTSISGHIGAEASPTLAGDYQYAATTIGPNGPVQNFEHTDGFNLIDVEVGHTHNLAVSQNGKHAVSVIGTVGAGVLIPKTNVTMFDRQLDNRFHLAGYGVSGSVGVRADVFRHFFVEGKLKGGYTEITNALTVDGGKASHNVLYAQPSLSVGVNIPLTGWR